MKTTRKIFTLIATVFVFAAIVSFQLPEDWFKGGSNHKNFDVGTDKKIKHSGNASATIKFTGKNVPDTALGFETLMQTCKPDKYLGRRVRMSGYLKLQDVTGWAGFWLRVDPLKPKDLFGFDNMAYRNLKGTQDWEQYSIVLDVPEGTSKLAYGALLSGRGQIWLMISPLKLLTNLSSLPVNNLSKRNIKDALWQPQADYQSPRILVLKINRQ
jgi:hypothetical protein